jgi:UDP-N-acetylmuramoyl-L-alanyl-D-glutamate--2,6-diaminopimelate ligase
VSGSVGTVSFAAHRAVLLRPQSGHTVSLAELFDESPSTAAVRVSGITSDSRMVAPGDLYVALPGLTRHGAEFLPQALAAGAVAVLTDPQGRATIGDLGAPVVVVSDPRPLLGELAAEIYGRPAEALAMFAVTGTNGKTTTTFLLDAALRAAGHQVGIVGTIGYLLNGRPLESVRTTVTTPESTELQGLLGYLRDGGADSVVMEVSSHALVLGRADAITFDVAAFTNFGRDHLDFHGDEESYFRAKASLFTQERTRHAVVNSDDPRGRQLIAAIRAAGEVGLTTISLVDPAADYSASSVRSEPDGRTRVEVRLPGRTLEFTLSLPGDFNVSNALTALAMLDAAGVDLDAAADGLASARVPGRMQRVGLGSGAPLVYVDFAHTPQAVTAALAAISGQRRIVVLGCGGDRDSAKRRPMGAAAAAAADVVIVTDDNPRSEDPSAIRAEVMAGALAGQRAAARQVTVIDGGDRRSAIREALGLARPGDALAILGKGHEVGQEIGDRTLPFDDAAVVAEEWADLRAPRPPARSGAGNGAGGGR